MADEGDPLLDLIGYRDILDNGTVAPRRSQTNFIGFTVADNPELGTTDVSLGTIDLNSQDIINARTITFGATPETQTTAGATLTIDWNLRQKHHVLVDETTTTVNFTNPPGTGNFTLIIEQSGGSFQLSGFDADIIWLNGTAPTFLDPDGSFRLLSFYWDGTRYFGEFNLGTYS